MEVRNIGTTATGEGVWTYVEGDRSSHIHNGINDSLLAEAISKLSPEGGFIRTTVDLGRVVGKDNCVATTGAHHIVFARREGRRGLTRFTKSQVAVPTRLISIVISRDKDNGGRWTLITAFFGQLAPREPWDQGIQNDAERATSVSFWNSHALVWESDPIVEGTETSECPW